MILKEQIRKTFQNRVTSCNYNYCREHGCENANDCDYPCEDFQVYCRLLMLENMIYGNEEGEKK